LRADGVRCCAHIARRPETAAQHSVPRNTQAAEAIAMIEQTFPDVQAQINSEREAATECQDLMGMSYRTFHFDGIVRVPGYVEWLLGCDVRGTYAFHRGRLKLLQWHCKSSLWNTKFLWGHRDPVKVLGSVCSLIADVHSWSSDHKDLAEHGAEQLTWRPPADPVNTVAGSYARLGFTFSDAAPASAQDWAAEHKTGHRGTHRNDLADYGPTRGHACEELGNYPGMYDASA
jgi:hypothetical protein